MKKNDHKNLSLSELSFNVINKNGDSLQQNEAYNEIKRRFSKNSCDHKIFMEYEEEAIEKRGDDITNYLINQDVNIQQLMETYFNYVCNRSLGVHDNLLFSELMLCNENCKNNFFSRIVKIELDRIKAKISSNNASEEEINRLQLISNLLDARLSKEISFWREDNIIDAVDDILCESPNFFTNEKYLEKKVEKLKKIDNRFLLFLNYLPIMIKQSLLNNDYLNYVAMEMFAMNDSAKLSKQKRSIQNSMNKDYNVDYSFLDEAKILQLGKIEKFGK